MTAELPHNLDILLQRVGLSAGRGRHFNSRARMEIRVQAPAAKGVQLSRLA
jgi:hypothetical protein